MRLSIADRLTLAMAAAALAAAFVAAALPHGMLGSTPLCWSVILLHRECPGCGLTRSFAAIARGDLQTANVLNPLGPVLFGWAVAVIVIRLGKRFLPRFPYWMEIDGALAAGVVLMLIVRAVLFYLV
jgi:hypothetical protein